MPFTAAKLKLVPRAPRDAVEAEVVVSPIVSKFLRMTRHFAVDRRGSLGFVFVWAPNEALGDA